MFSSIGLPEILVIFTAVLILFGGRKIPQLARDLGTGIREFKRSLLNAKDGIDKGLDSEERANSLVQEEILPRNSVKKTSPKAVKKTPPKKQAAKKPKKPRKT